MGVLWWKRKFRLYGGDLRIAKLAELFAMEKYTVFLYGQSNYFKEKIQSSNLRECKTIEECIRNTDMIISGIPLSRDKQTIFAPYTNEKIELNKLYMLLEEKTFIAGGIPKWFWANETIELVDLLECEELTILNAIPTVEGTIKIAIEETENTIHESNVLILGYGRIGKILCSRFSKLGANIYCAARKQTDMAWIREEGFIPVDYEEICKYGEKFDLIINTVPEIMLKKEEIKGLKKECLIIDVASEPGGVDKIVAEMYKIRVITAPGLPGKIAPLTAASYIKRVVDKYIGGK